MNNVPYKYQWLLKEEGPKILKEALKYYGVEETPGEFRDNPAILRWAEEAGVKNYKHDERAWCGLFMTYVAFKSGISRPKNSLWAKHWAKIGQHVDYGSAVLGDILIFNRDDDPKKGHIGLYVGEDEDAYHVLGGNQHNEVSITRIGKQRIFEIRRPISPENYSSNMRKVFLEKDGDLSQNEI